jgi:hypothetical protein
VTVGVAILNSPRKLIVPSIVVICLILLSGVVWGLPNASAYGNGGASSQKLSMTINGGVLGAGNQIYNIRESGQAISASLAGFKIDESKPIQFTYFLNANVNGLTVSGSAFFVLRGTLQDGKSISMVGYAVLGGEVPAVCFPSFSTSGACEPGDTSAIPAFFLSSQAEIFVTVSGQESNANSELGRTTTTTTISIPMVFESAYLNPFGAPIVLGSADGFATLLVITPYNSGTISWRNVVTAGQISGTYGTTPVSGILTQFTFERENLVTGTALDHGEITFSSMVASSNGQPLKVLDANGEFHGVSITPKQGGVDCSASIGFPPGSGLCTEYGFMSTGTFNMHGRGSTIHGSYSTIWGIPALTFTAVSLAKVTTTSQ